MHLTACIGMSGRLDAGEVDSDGRAWAFVTTAVLFALLTAPAASAASSTIPVGSGPRSVAVNPSTNTVYVANAGSNTVSVIDGSTGTVASTISVGSSPRQSPSLVPPSEDRRSVLRGECHQSRGESYESPSSDPQQTPDSKMRYFTYVAWHSLPKKDHRCAHTSAL